MCAAPDSFMLKDHVAFLNSLHDIQAEFVAEVESLQTILMPYAREVSCRISQDGMPGICVTRQFLTDTYSALEEMRAAIVHASAAYDLALTLQKNVPM